MNNMTLYSGLVDAKIRASYKDLPVTALDCSSPRFIFQNELFFVGEKLLVDSNDYDLIKIDLVIPR